MTVPETGKQDQPQPVETENGKEENGQDGGTENVTADPPNTADTGGTQLTSETIEVTQEAHPIRKFFSSLFK